MKSVNVILTLLSLNSVLIIVERLSFTTQIILQPYDFLRLHEVVQMLVIILISVILPYFLLKELSHNFSLLKSKTGTLLGLLFITGVYFYATGNGAHEIASYLFNTFCNTKTIETTACGSMFFNDYYFGNILYFFGFLLINIALVKFELMNPNKSFKKNDMTITFINAVIMGTMLFLYAAFDTVAVGLIYCIIAAIMNGIFLFSTKTKKLFLPFTVYSFVSSLLPAIGAAIIRLR